jgi:hypothetical protein
MEVLLCLTIDSRRFRLCIIRLKRKLIRRMMVMLWVREMIKYRIRHRMGIKPKRQPKQEQLIHSRHQAKVYRSIKIIIKMIIYHKVILLKVKYKNYRKMVYNQVLLIIKAYRETVVS